MVRNKLTLLPCLLSLVLMSASCGGKNESSRETTTEGETRVVTETPFSADSAYAAVAHQVAFGPRVPGREAHKQ